MTSRTTAAFRKALSSLPSDVRDLAHKAFVLFEQDPRHPSLRFKRVHSTRPIYSARISLGYRALAVRDDDTWVWFWIGNHGDYDSLLKRL